MEMKELIERKHNLNNVVTIANPINFDEFNFKCAVGKNGITSKKLEGDLKTPKGQYQFDTVYFRPDRVKRPVTKRHSLKNRNLGRENRKINVV